MAMQAQETCVMYIQWTHKSLLATTGALPAEQFLAQPSPTSPPIGWHLFHVARWADRMQASFGPHVSAALAAACYPGEVWVQDGLARIWGLEAKRLGFLVAVGQQHLFDYAGQVLWQWGNSTCLTMRGRCSLWRIRHAPDSPRQSLPRPVAPFCPASNRRPQGNCSIRARRRVM